MAFIRQYQRRAIEEFSPFQNRQSFTVFPYRIRFRLVNGRPLYFLGFSEGIGTCSDIHGMNVAVFSLQRPEKPQSFSLNFGENCTYGVLLKIASEDECRIADRDPKLSAHGCVELLQLEKIEGYTFIFELTNKKAVYPLIV
ncbi:MAG: hypothetical protein A3I24_04555 [Candidatus Harrisonbacteria bacterium RIFCSPLOWO2_02_FULL_41_13b]|uniref:Uncharacterized protein n=1 Tax=Candidatus Harrisonbacteria bacterium RIFCSPLOWO2_02_FULL_41_13b TaxID=1798409 RepID=A0A1G1ZQH3_9BACT|nr:MAG: hypothetical protein A3J53_02785 [Candidatus Harrisonbacteria bacterium RIFCSPHIGHO2_02_FULL_40_20]OGY66761.1 MAG: hypothetical protein A3I24_04555 [Candidatus Harrisonbacteria bacterium RIFCSPLOWO2_02_FULL_41_13b]